MIKRSVNKQQWGKEFRQTDRGVDKTEFFQDEVVELEDYFENKCEWCGGCSCGYYETVVFDTPHKICKCCYAQLKEVVE